MENNSKILSELTLSSNSSFQSNSELTIECCICGETVNNDNSYMPNCKHSWCKDCNKKLIQPVKVMKILKALLNLVYS